MNLSSMTFYYVIQNFLSIYYIYNTIVFHLVAYPLESRSTPYICKNIYSHAT